MAWTSPRTWSDGEVPTDAMLNAHVRDNMLLLKTSRDDLGRFIGLTSSYVASLDGTSLTGLAQLAANSSYAGGSTRFVGSSLLKVPVGVDKYATDTGLPTPGSLWVEGNYLHHIDATRTEWQYLGNVISSPGAQPGFVMVVAAGLRYTDESGVIRECVSSSPQHADVTAAGGSLWVDGSYVNIVQDVGTQAWQVHQDIAHTDHNDHHDHTDHADVTHVDHTDHTDNTVPHVDAGGIEGGHADHTDHTDHTDHGDITPQFHNDHNDFTHADAPADQRPVLA